MSAEPTMLVILATRPYGLAADGTAVLPEGVTLEVMPRYVGHGVDGKIVDDRVTLVLQDEANSFWPVIARMDREIVHGLVEAIGAAVR